MADQIYNEKMCDKAMQILSGGKSIAKLAASLGVCRETIYEWRDKHPEFANALRCGKEASQAFWEEMGEEGMLGEIKNFSAAMWIFTMKNRFRDDYREEKTEKTVSESVIEKFVDRLVDN